MHFPASQKKFVPMFFGVFATVSLALGYPWDERLYHEYYEYFQNIHVG